MDVSALTLLILAALIFVVATLYSSVGHGGASGYLAVLAFFSVAPQPMAGTALILNVLVSGLAAVTFIRAGHFSFRLFWPFAVTSIPLAFVGGLLKITDNLYHVLLAFALLIAAIRLSWANPAAGSVPPGRPLRLSGALPVGAGVGLLSGMVGIGGGIFLSPVMMLMKWATAKETAAVAAVFILVNSLAGLAGRTVNGQLQIIPMLFPMLAAATGGLLGSHWGANRISSLMLRRILACVLLIAAIKLVITIR
jgi:uncharacterized membrane protein YfcA